MYKKEKLIKIVEKSKSKTEVLSKLGKKNFGGNFNTLNFYLEKYEIDISHFNNRGNKNFGKIKKRKLSDILVENSTYSSSHHLKGRLYSEGLKERKCEKCGQDENWYGEKMSLILDHINGIHNDNRIENLRILCPNCNATLDTHCRGDRYLKTYKQKKIEKIEKEKRKNKEYFCECGTKIRKNSKCCRKCSDIKQRKVKRPSYGVLLNEVKKLGLEGTGRKYGVTGNSVKKWLKK
jgi:hypothetical protein